MNTWGQKLKLSIFGESHGPGLGIVVDGLPSGENISLEEVQTEMARRAPGNSPLTTSRREKDEVSILSGLMDGRTTGAPVCGLIFNSDARSGDYARVFRPGHADWSAWLKYEGQADLRGGGHFSGRLTAPVVFAGAMAKQILGRRQISVHGRIAALAGIEDSKDAPALADIRRDIAAKSWPVFDEAAGKMMQARIKAAKEDGDSVGGIIEAAAFGLPGGLGEPFFGSAESVISSIIFSIPGVKGIEFGEGFRFADFRGSEANDELTVVDGRITALTNHNGGLLGGISNGQPVVVRVAVKPTPSIAKEQRSVDPLSREESLLRIRGRHDPSIVPRAVVVVEAAVALSILDLALTAGKVQ